MPQQPTQTGFSEPSASAPDPMLEVGQPLPELGQLVDLVDTVKAFADHVGRTDLGERLEQTHSRLIDPNIRVMVAGGFKQGKSKLINALVNAPICPVDDDIATSVPTVVEYGPVPEGWVMRRPDGQDVDAELVREAIPLEKLSQYVSERGNPGNHQNISVAQVQLPREILKGGLQLVDSPGVGGQNSSNTLSTLSALASAHAVIVVSDASQEYTAPEVQFLKHAMRISPNVAVVLSKTDLHPEWRRIQNIDRRRLEQIGDIPLFAVSSDLRILAASHRDRVLNTESGFPNLVTHIRSEIVQRAAAVNTRAAVHDISSVVQQIMVAMRTELEAIRNPQDCPRLILELQAAQAEVEKFRGRTSRWQVALNDGMADLISDMEHDLRDRLRRVQRDAEAAIDEGDPGPIWEQIVEWLDDEVAKSISETFVWTDERSRWLAEEVADLFTEDESLLPTISVSSVEGALDPVDQVPDLDPGHLGAAEKIFIGVRGSYGGLLIVGLATGLIGLSLINPISLVAGVLVGRRAYKEDMKTRLSRRRFEAKNLIRRYIEEIIFQVGKQLKDRLRLVQRTSRDHFTKLADELHRSLVEAANNAKRTAEVASGDREQRAQQLAAGIRQLEAIAAQVPELPELSGMASPPTK